MDTLKERVEYLLKLHGRDQAEATRLGGFKNPAFINDILRGHKESVRVDNLEKLARALGGTTAFLLSGDIRDLREPSEADEPFVAPASNAGQLIPVRFPKAERLPVYGQGVGGDDGKFVLNGQRVADAMCPPNLIGVRDAYAVFVDGTSMEPRYFAGETVFLHPHIPVRKGDFVVAQIAADVEGDPPYGYVKQFVSKSSRGLVLRQLNPPDGQDELMEFPVDKVVAVHKIVFLEQG